MTSRNHALVLMLASAMSGCGDDATGTSAESIGTLESLGEYTVSYNTCGPHWEGTYAFSANRVAQFGQGTDQLFVEPTDPNAPANRGRGDVVTVEASSDFSLQISFDVDSQLLVYQCNGTLDVRAAVVSCSADAGETACELSFVSASGAQG